jgi:hypothetical protein
MTDWLITAARGKPQPSTNEYAGMTDAELAAKVRDHVSCVIITPFGFHAPKDLLEEVARRLETK